MTDVQFAAVTEASLEDWRRIHNAIIPSDPLSSDQVRERMGRNRLQLALVADEVVGCSTVRPPADPERVATVIVRVLPGYRRQGIGTAFYERELATARALDPAAIETVVLATNVDGLAFAERHGFVEVDRYVLDGDEIAFIDLRLP